MTPPARGLSGAADRLTAWLWRWRRLLAVLSVIGAFLLAPLADIRTLDNDIGAWFKQDDPVYKDYERLKKEFPGSRTLIIAIESADAFSPDMLEALRRISSDIEQVQVVRRVQSLATANTVRLRPAVPSAADAASPRSSGAADAATIDPAEDADDDLVVEPLVPRGGPIDAAAVRKAALADRMLAGDLVSPSGRVLAIVVSFDEARIDAVRAAVLEEIRTRVSRHLPSGATAHYNGSIEISETYNRVTLRNQVLFTPPILLITIVAIYVMFRSVRLTALTIFAVLVSTLWTVGLYMWAGFGFNILTSMLPPLVLVLAIADDVHIIQHYTQCRRDGADHERAWTHTVRHLITPLLAASGTTALGLLSLATSSVDAVRTFGLGAALGVMVDFAISIVLMPTLLGLVAVSPEPPPQARWLLGPMRAIGRVAATYPHRVIVAASIVLVAVGFGLTWLRVDTNHIAFFKPGHPLHDSAELMDRELAGIYSFQVMLEGPPESLRSADAIARIDTLRERLEGLGHVRKVVGLSDYVARVHEPLAPEDSLAGKRLPTDDDLISQELFVFGMSEDGRRELESIVSSDYSRTQVMVKLASMSSDEAFVEVEHAERIARALFAGTAITPTVTGAGRLFATLDHYLVTSQVASFATAFLSVFGVIFLVFRSFKFGVLAIVPNVVPVVIVLGAMGWLDISMNVATVMVASIALGVVDDDTIHFISRYRREARAGRSTQEAIAIATEEEGRASLTTAIINTLAFSVLMLSDYRPSGWFGGLLALTMAVAFLAEVFLLPAMITLLPRWFAAETLRVTSPAADVA
jgi:predicted RND superfamily exporter protein